MPDKRLLLLSNSKNYNQGYLEHALDLIKDLLGESVKTVLFIPFAGVTFTFGEYAARVGERFAEAGYRIASIHETADAKEAVGRAEAIAVGGGNSFHLLRSLYEAELLAPIRERVERGVPYIGWSAGSNVACPTIKTTNDMPIVEPPSLTAINLVPFQINPHYTDEQVANHQGETREQRLMEFIEVNPGVYTVGLREGSSLKVTGANGRLLGGRSARVFIKGEPAREYGPEDPLEFLLRDRGV